MKRFFFLSIMLVVSVMSLFGQAEQWQYSSHRQARIMEQLQALDKKKPILITDTLVRVPAVSEEVDVVLLHDSLNLAKLTHVGLALPPIGKVDDFSGMPVLAFLERYLLELLVTDDDIDLENDLKINKVRLFSETLTGSKRQIIKKALRAMTEKTSLQISQEGMTYHVTFLQPDGSRFLTMDFPARYDLILGLTKDEAEEAMVALLSDITSGEELTTEISANAGAGMKRIPCDTTRYDQQQMHLDNESWYMSKSIQSTTYLVGQEGEYRPVFGEKHRMRSIMNLFNYPADYGVKANVTFSLYHGKAAGEIALSRLLQYMRDSGYTLYTGISGVDGRGHTRGTVYAVNLTLGCHHQLSYDVPRTITYLPEASPVEIKMRLYIPIYNFKGLK